jgi:phenylpyruvate tautomerase PptA (4-oxalocrotonate tautomerase family)
MPMIDAYIPEGALQRDAEERLFRELTDLLIRLEGFEPTNERARSATWLFLHRPTVYVAGALAATPRYRFILSVPEGQYDDDVRGAVVRQVTEAVARAEGVPFEEVSPRVWVFPIDIPDGTWGGRGAVRRLPDILANIVGEHERQVAVVKLAKRRRQTAVTILDAARQTADEPDRN